MSTLNEDIMGSQLLPLTPANMNHVVYNTSSVLENPSPGGNVTASLSKSVIFPSAMFLFGVFGNVTAIIILTIRPSKDSRSTAFYHLVKALAYTDLLGIVALSPVTIAVYINGGLLKTGGLPLCHYFSFVLVMAGNATLFIVLIMAGERFLVTKFPFKYSQLVTPLSVNCTLVAVWVLSIVCGVLPIIGLGSNTEHWPGTWCFVDYRSDSIGARIFSFTYAIIGLLVIVITIVLNITVIKHLWRMRKTRRIATSVRSYNHSMSVASTKDPDSERRMVIFLMAIIIVFTVCYVPLMACIILSQIVYAGGNAPVGGLADALDLWALRLASLNQLLDPWVYIISRVTCCRGDTDSDRERSQSKRSAIMSSGPTSTHEGHAPASVNSIHNHKRDSRLSRTIQRVRRMLGKSTQDSKDKAAAVSLTAATPLRTDVTSKGGQIVEESSWTNNSDGSTTARGEVNSSPCGSYCDEGNMRQLLGNDRV